MSISKPLQLKFTNAVCHLHGLICNCDQPVFHSSKLLLNQLQPELPTTKKQELQKCLGITPEEEDGAAAGLDFGEDLEKLFAEDTEEDTMG